MAAKSTKTKLSPAPGVLVIEPEEKQTKTASGIYLPDSSDEKPQRGKVLEVGPDEISESGATKSSHAEKGDTVVYKKWGGNEVKVDGKELLFVKFDDILAVVK